MNFYKRFHPLSQLLVKTLHLLHLHLYLHFQGSEYSSDSQSNDQQWRSHLFLFHLSWMWGEGHLLRSSSLPLDNRPLRSSPSCRTIPWWKKVAGSKTPLIRLVTFWPNHSKQRKDAFRRLLRRVKLDAHHTKARPGLLTVSCLAWTGQAILVTCSNHFTNVWRTIASFISTFQPLFIQRLDASY